MKLTRKGILGLAIAALVVMAAAAVPVLGQGWGHGPHHGEQHGRMMERIMERLELTEEQRAEAEALMTERHEAMSASFDRIQKAREKLADTIHAADFDETAIRDAAAVVATIEADLAVERGLANQAFRKILTPEQQAEFDEMHQTLRAYRHEFGGRGGYGPGPHGPKHP
jgi:Spy/CpxP family protein refolding chaperone